MVSPCSSRERRACSSPEVPSETCGVGRFDLSAATQRKRRSARRNPSSKTTARARPDRVGLDAELAPQVAPACAVAAFEAEVSNLSRVQRPSDECATPVALGPCLSPIVWNLGDLVLEARRRHGAHEVNKGPHVLATADHDDGTRPRSTNTRMPPPACLDLGDEAHDVRNRERVGGEAYALRVRTMPVTPVPVREGGRREAQVRWHHLRTPRVPPTSLRQQFAVEARAERNSVLPPATSVVPHGGSAYREAVDPLGRERGPHLLKPLESIDALAKNQGAAHRRCLRVGTEISVAKQQSRDQSLQARADPSGEVGGGQRYARGPSRPRSPGSSSLHDAAQRCGLCRPRTRGVCRRTCLLGGPR